MFYLQSFNQPPSSKSVVSRSLTVIGCPVCGGEAVAVSDWMVQVGVVSSRQHFGQDLSMATGSSQVECSAAPHIASQDCGIVGQQYRNAVLPAEQGLRGGKGAG